MTSRTSPEGRRVGMTLVEVIIVTLVLGAALAPLLGQLGRNLAQSRTNQRMAMAESLSRDVVEHIKSQKRINGFNWIWTNWGDQPASVSGFSSPAGSPMNPALDAVYRVTTVDPTGDRFDRVVAIRRRWLNVPDLPLTGSNDPFPGADTNAGEEDVRFLEVRVNVFCDDDPVLDRPGPGERPFFEIVTWIGDSPST